MTSSVAPRVRVAAIITANDEVLLVRHEKDDHTYWMLPGGGVAFGESLETALKRELLEETGLSIDIGELVLLSDAIANDGSRHIVNLCFSATVSAGAPTLGTDARIVEVAFLPVDSLASIQFFPPFGPALQECIRAGFSGPSRYLGNLWESLDSRKPDAEHDEAC